MSEKEKAVREEMPGKAFALGVEYEKRCTGCAQSTVAAVLDVLDVESEDTFRAASGMADGIGLSGDGSCGVLIGGAMVIGLLFGRERKDFADPMKPMKSYLLARELHGDFLARYGSCRCHDIQKKLMGRTYNLMDPVDLDAAVSGGMIDHCSRVVGEGARKTVELVMKGRGGSAGR